jgi:hypothetical protein
MGKLLQEEVEHLLKRHETCKITQDEYDRIMRLFIGDIGCPAPKLLELLRMLVAADVRQRYINEVKAFLRENDEELYQRYASCFTGNTGCMEAFGIRSEVRIPRSTDNEPDHFVRMKPVLSLRRRKGSDRQLRRDLKKESRTDAHRKALREKQVSEEYKRKMDEIYARIRKG